MCTPTLTLQQIANYCGKDTYLKGVEYEDSEALMFRYKQDNMLLGICEGTKAPRYITKIMFNGSAIEQSSCTCDYNQYLPCKHIAALLVTWFYYPATFIEKEKWFQALDRYEKVELMDLIGKMLDIHISSKDITQYQA